MMSDFRGGGSKMTPKNRTLEGKNRTLGGGGGFKNRRKSSDIIYVRSLMLKIHQKIFSLYRRTITYWLEIMQSGLLSIYLLNPVDILKFE